MAVILVIAVPKVMNIINDTKKSTFSNSVKLIASSAEQRYAENKVLGTNDKITCKDVAKLSTDDYKLCEITFKKEEARVTVIGDGKFDGLSIVYASKTNAEVQEGEPERLYTFDDVYSLIDELKNEVNTYKKTIEELRSNINSINPSAKFGGTWVAYGTGRTLVGVDSSQEEFASVELTGGEKTHTLTIDEMLSHSHLYSHVAHPIAGIAWTSVGSQTIYWSSSEEGVGKTGDSQPHNNLQPYITVYMWKRTA